MCPGELFVPVSNAKAVAFTTVGGVGGTGIV